MLTQENIDLYQLMIKIFEQIYKFKNLQEALYNSALDEYHRREMNQEDMDDQSQLISPEAHQQLVLLGQQYRKTFDKFNNKKIESQL